LDALLAKTPPVLVLTVLSYTTNPSCVPTMMLLTLMVADINKRFQFLSLDAPIAQTPVNFGPKSYFW